MSMSQATRASSVRLAGVVMLAGSAALAAACTSGTSNSGGTVTPGTTTPATSPATTSTASAAACKHVSSLRSSLQDLTHLQLNASSSQQIRTDLTNIQTQLTALKTEGGGMFSTEISSVSASLKQVEKAAGKLSSNPSAAQVQAIIAALSSLKSSSKAAVTQMNASCPG